MKRLLVFVIPVLAFVGIAKAAEHPAPQPTPPVGTIALAPVTTPLPPLTQRNTWFDSPNNMFESAEIEIIMEVNQMAHAHPRCSEWLPEALRQGWPLEEWPTLSRVLWKESRCDAFADSGPDHGLTQINRIHTAWLADFGWTHDDMKDPKKNLHFAYRLWTTSGWKPWSITPSPDL